MKLENISKIFGVLSFVCFLLAVWEFIANYGSEPKYSFLGATILFLMAAILTTLKRVAHDMEKRGKE